MVSRAPLRGEASARIAMASWAAITSGVPDILLHHDAISLMACQLGRYVRVSVIEYLTVTM